MKTIIVFAVSFLVATTTWAQQASTAVPSGSTETVNTDNVPIEEYVPKVIIEGKWGTGPGEFGAIDPMQAEYYTIAMNPNSLAVNSKGDIYILDHLNNRIQKFNATGTFIADIPVYSFSDNKGESRAVLKITPLSEGGARFDVQAAPSYIGISIVIDSNDTLYYYLKRVKDGKETGEVWEFKGDKLVGKTSKTGTQVASAEFPQKPIDVKFRNHNEIRLSDGQKKEVVLLVKKGERFFDDASALKRRISNKVRRDRIGLLGVVCEQNGELWTNYYKADGTLVKKFRWSSKPSITGYFDRDRNMYLPETTDIGMRILKYELRESK